MRLYLFTAEYENSNYRNILGIYASLASARHILEAEFNWEHPGASFRRTENPQKGCYLSKDARRSVAYLLEVFRGMDTHGCDRVIRYRIEEYDLEGSPLEALAEQAE